MDKLETTFVDLSKLSDVVKIEVVKKTMYDELIKKVIAIPITDISNEIKTHKLVKLKRKFLIMIIIISILLLKNLIS